MFVYVCVCVCMIHTHVHYVCMYVWRFSGHHPWVSPKSTKDYQTTTTRLRSVTYVRMRHTHTQSMYVWDTHTHIEYVRMRHTHTHRHRVCTYETHTHTHTHREYVHMRHIQTHTNLSKTFLVTYQEGLEHQLLQEALGVLVGRAGSPLKESSLDWKLNEVQVCVTAFHTAVLGTTATWSQRKD